MRICMIGDFSPNLDEGYKNVSHHLANQLIKNSEVFLFNVKGLLKIKMWHDLFNANSQIVHSISQPTTWSLFLLYFVSRYFKNSYRVLSSLKIEQLFSSPMRTKIFQMVCRLLKPDLVLIQDPDHETFFRHVGVENIKLLLNGVDLRKFSPVDSTQKKYLREKHFLKVSSPTILHVGHLRQERNLNSLARLAQYDFQVILAGSKYLSRDEKLVKYLRKAGVIIFEGYLPEIEELYQLSDCYFFPVLPGNSISMPLSILEALACGIPVVTTKFGAIESAFGEGNGVYYYSSDFEIIQKITQAIGECRSPQKYMKSYSWQNISMKLNEYYGLLITS